MKFIKNISLISMLIALAILIGCGKESTSEPKPPAQNEPQDTIPEVNLTDTLTRKWSVTEASHNGTPDNSSKGLVLDVRNNGTYTLVSSGYEGTWEFIEDYKKVLLDKNTPQYKTTWEIIHISSVKLEVKFKSPFTGGNSEWILEPK